ncbi:MAG: DNA oxidative demethylase AlkB [Acidihalobacter sp.]|uniref:DNA oxidative demethylase AlkB n=1 Tax=Acidihalobacter sp. TaxID=1872108 RepID=UPI00307ECA03
MSRIPDAATGDLFADTGSTTICEGAVLLHGFAAAEATQLMEAITGVYAQAPPRHMITPGGHRMSAAMSNCGRYGWVTDHRGYRYETTDPDTGRPWPPIPGVIATLARRAAAAAGHADFEPDACLINRYAPGAKMSLHQDRDEQDFSAPIVSVSLGLSATFLFGGSKRNERPRRIVVQSGDVIVWGGSARLNFHGIAPLPEGEHPLTGTCRINLTLRRAR